MKNPGLMDHQVPPQSGHDYLTPVVPSMNKSGTHLVVETDEFCKHTSFFTHSIHTSAIPLELSFSLGCAGSQPLQRKKIYASGKASWFKKKITALKLAGKRRLLSPGCGVVLHVLGLVPINNLWKGFVSVISALGVEAVEERRAWQEGR